MWWSSPSTSSAKPSAFFSDRLRPATPGIRLSARLQRSLVSTLRLASLVGTARPSSLRRSCEIGDLLVGTLRMIACCVPPSAFDFFGVLVVFGGVLGPLDREVGENLWARENILGAICVLVRYPNVSCPSGLTTTSSSVPQVRNVIDPARRVGERWSTWSYSSSPSPSSSASSGLSSWRPSGFLREA